MTKVHDYFEKYTFLCEMYHEEADKVIQLIVHFFPFDNSIQVIDAKRGKCLVKRSQTKRVTREMLQIGNVINVFSRLLFIKDCTPATHDLLIESSEKTFAFIKPCKPELHGKILSHIILKGFRIVNLKNAKLDKDTAIKFYEDVGGVLPIVVDYVTSGEILAMEIEGPNAVARFRELLGDTDPRTAAPGTLRRMFGESKLRNIAHGCKTPEEAAKLIEIMFGSERGQLRVPYRASLRDCTCCVVKPRAVTAGHCGAIMEHIAASGRFYISCVGMFAVPLVCAKEFYEVYKNVLPEYDEMCFNLAAGKCIAMEVKAVDPSVDVVSEFRKLCGPRDPELCRQLYPGSLRARYGQDTVRNAVHCTDLPEDGVAEVEYIFKLLTHYISAF